MLGGIAPIFLFNVSKLLPTVTIPSVGIPVVDDAVGGLSFTLPIPLYLDEQLFGIVLDSESKAIDIETAVDTTAGGATPITNQNALSSTVTINLVAQKDSIGLILLSAIMDLIFPKVTSKEYSISYLNGATTIFGGLLQSYTVTQNSNDDKMNITIVLIKHKGGTVAATGPVVVNPALGPKP